ncbi:hypothetical protein A2U01_0078347, partial [Trifolium medium]|nr:hypothetical protein [Trifolium medium]
TLQRRFFMFCTRHQFFNTNLNDWVSLNLTVKYGKQEWGKRSSAV